MGDHVQVGSEMFGPGRVPGPGIELYLKEEREKRLRQVDGERLKLEEPRARSSE